MDDCIFCRLVRGELPISKIAEDEHTLSFLNIVAAHPGHALVIVKPHRKDIFELDDTLSAAVFQATAKVAKAVKAAGGESAPTVVSLRGRSADVDRVRSVRVLRADGTELSASGLQVTTAGETGTLELLLAEPPPVDATLVLGLLTKRSVVAVPFELKEVALP